MRRSLGEHVGRNAVVPAVLWAAPHVSQRWYSDRNQKLSPDRTRNETISDRQSRFQWTRLHHVRPHHRFTHDPLSWNRSRDREVASARARELPILSRLAVLEERAAEQKRNQDALRNQTQSRGSLEGVLAEGFSSTLRDAVEGDLPNHSVTLSPILLHRCRSDYEQALRHGKTPNDARSREVAYAVLLRQALECLEESCSTVSAPDASAEPLSAATVVFLGCELFHGAEVLLRSLAVEGKGADSSPTAAAVAGDDVLVSAVTEVHLCRLWRAVVPRLAQAVDELLVSLTRVDALAEAGNDWRSAASACLQAAYCVTHPLVLRVLPLMMSLHPMLAATVRLCREPLTSTACSRAAVALLQRALAVVRRGLAFPSAALGDDHKATRRPTHEAEVPLSPPLLLLAWTTLRRVHRGSNAVPGVQKPRSRGRGTVAKKRSEQIPSLSSSATSEDALGDLVDGFLSVTTQSVRMLTATVKRQYERHEGAVVAAHLSLTVVPSPGSSPQPGRGSSGPVGELGDNEHSTRKRRRMPFVGAASRSMSSSSDWDPSHHRVRSEGGIAPAPLPTGDVACLLNSLAICVSLRPLSLNRASAASRFGRTATVVDLLCYVPNYSIPVEPFADWWAASRQFVWADGCELPKGVVSQDGYDPLHRWASSRSGTSSGRGQRFVKDESERWIVTHKLVLIASRLATETASPSALRSLMESVVLSTGDEVPASTDGERTDDGADAKNDEDAERRRPRGASDDDGSRQLRRIGADIKRLRGICLQKVFRSLPPNYLWTAKVPSATTCGAAAIISAMVTCDVAVPITWWRDAVREWLSRPDNDPSPQLAPSPAKTTPKAPRKKTTGSSASLDDGAATGLLLVVLRTQCRAPQQQQSLAMREGEDKRALAMSEHDWGRLRALVRTALPRATRSNDRTDQFSPLTEDELGEIVKRLAGTSPPLLRTDDTERRRIERRLRGLANS